MADKTLGVALVGCGLFGEVHAETYAAFHLADLRAVCDIDAERAEAFAQRYGCRACTDLGEIAADPEIAAVSVATPDFAHREVCEALLEAGKHLLIEKPLATSSADAEAIASAADRAGTVVMVDFHNRYQPALATLKKRLEAGQLGAAQMAYARLSDRIEVATRWFQWSGKSGPQWFLGSHLADAVCWLFADWPVRVFADGRKDVLAGRGIDCYDSMHIHLTFPDAFATLETSWIMPDTWPMICDFSLSLQGTAARADMDMSMQGLTVVGETGFERPLLVGRTPIAADTFGFMPFPIHDFVRTVLSGDEPFMPVGDGVRNVRIIEAAVRSAETGQVVDLAW